MKRALYAGLFAVGALMVIIPGFLLVVWFSFTQGRGLFRELNALHVGFYLVLVIIGASICLYSVKSLKGSTSASE